MVCSLAKGLSGTRIRFNRVRYTDAIKREVNLLDDGVVDALVSVGATSRVHIPRPINASNSRSPSRSTSRG